MSKQLAVNLASILGTLALTVLALFAPAILAALS
jgi:hypothetical protein